VKKIKLNKDGFQYGNVLTISIAHLVHDIYSSFLAPILPLLIEKLSISYAMVGLLSLIQRLPSLINPFIGLMADRIALRYLLIFSPVITAISMSLLGVAHSITVLAILLLVMGVSSTMFHVPGPVMIKKVSGKLTGRGMSFFMFGGELARTIGPLIILGGVSLWGLEGTYKLIPLGLLASLILYFRLRKIKIADDFSKNNEWSGIGNTLRKHLPLFIILIGMTFFRSVMKSALTIFLPTYMNLRGESLWMGGISLSILELAGAAGTLIIGSYSDKIGRKAVLLIISIAAPVLMWLFTIAGKPLEWPLLVLLGFFLFGFTPVVLALIQDRATERPAFLNGIFMTISFGMGALAVLLVGALSDWIGMELTFKISAFLSLGTVPFVLMLVEQPKRRDRIQ